ncbi:MAG: hypothetical protein R3202_04285 [Candidatus Competibacterales bacterium]|nr:hypothetical protein [Candidatus Competibacterales bacterium]
MFRKRFRQSAIVVLMAASLLFLAVKLFSTELTYPDDPSIALVLRNTPSLSNHTVLDSTGHFSDHAVLWIDENAYPGMRLYQWITNWLWWLTPLVTGVLLVATRNVRDSKASS